MSNYELLFPYSIRLLLLITIIFMQHLCHSAWLLFAY